MQNQRSNHSRSTQSYCVMYGQITLAVSLIDFGTALQEIIDAIGETDSRCHVQRSTQQLHEKRGYQKNKSSKHNLPLPLKHCVSFATAKRFRWQAKVPTKYIFKTIRVWFFIISLKVGWSLNINTDLSLRASMNYHQQLGKVSTPTSPFIIKHRSLLILSRAYIPPQNKQHQFCF